ncbi:biotin--[acetyl-CoA-carboxylase] ligase [Alicyclobacillaceae bacterium I2511]|nr:biotin--[acetyl-CoA-carboxylase] ligase [Alicyclobacillaceae bacterium I2511]
MADVEQRNIHPTTRIPVRSESEQIRDQIIQFFLQANGGFVSTRDLSVRLGISRTAVWKHIQLLESIGFSFTVQPRLGHRLEIVPNIILLPLLERHLSATCQLGREVKWLSEVDSTNAVATRLAALGAPHGTVVVAARQTAGRGRRGRTWFSPVGGLWVSVLLRRPIPLQHAAELTLLSSFAMRRALMAETNLHIDVKWPNDLLYNGKKVCGILAEIRSEGESLATAVLGMGVNTNLLATDFPTDLLKNAATLSTARNQPVSHQKVLAQVLSQLDPWVEQLSTGQSVFPQIAKEWRQSCITLGQSVRVNTPAGLVTGQAIAVDDGGILYVRTQSGLMQKIHTGDVLFEEGQE